MCFTFAYGPACWKQLSHGMASTAQPSIGCTYAYCWLKFMCLMHREVKQTEMSESGAEKGLLQGAARQVAHAVKTPELPTGFQHCIFKGQVRESGLKISLCTCLTG